MKYVNRWLHKSHLKIYELCPKKFDITYEDVIRKDKKQYSIALSEGTAFHDWAAYIVDNNITDINEIKEHIKIQSLCDMIEWFIDVNNETKTVEDYTEMYLETKSKLRGTIDRYYVNENGEGVLVEYKTGRTNNFRNTWIDFGFYTILLIDNDFVVDKWRLINPRTKRDVTKPIDNNAIERVRDMIAEIRTRTEFEPTSKVTYACNDCNYQLECPTYCGKLPYKGYIDVIRRLRL